MTQKQVLDLKTVYFEQVDDEHSERAQAWKRRRPTTGAFGD